MRINETHKTYDISHDWIKKEVFPPPFTNNEKELGSVQKDLRKISELTRDSLGELEKGFRLLNKNYDEAIGELQKIDSIKSIRDVFIVQSALKMIGYDILADGIYQSSGQKRKNQESQTMQVLSQYRKDNNLSTSNILVDKDLITSLIGSVAKMKYPLPSESTIV